MRQFEPARKLNKTMVDHIFDVPGNFFPVDGVSPKHDFHDALLFHMHRNAHRLQMRTG